MRAAAHAVETDPELLEERGLVGDDQFQLALTVEDTTLLVLQRVDLARGRRDLVETGESERVEPGRAR